MPGAINSIKADLLHFRSKVMDSLTANELEVVRNYTLTKHYQRGNHEVILVISPNQVSLFSSKFKGTSSVNGIEAVCVFKADEIVINQKYIERYSSDGDEIEKEDTYYFAINRGEFGVIKQQKCREENWNVVQDECSTVSAEKREEIITKNLLSLPKDWALITPENFYHGYQHHALTTQKCLHPSVIVTTDKKAVVEKPKSIFQAPSALVRPKPGSKEEGNPSVHISQEHALQAKFMQAYRTEFIEESSGFFACLFGKPQAKKLANNAPLSQIIHDAISTPDGIEMKICTSKEFNWLNKDGTAHTLAPELIRDLVLSNLASATP